MFFSKLGIFSYLAGFSKYPNFTLFYAENCSLFCRILTAIVKKSNKNIVTKKS